MFYLILEEIFWCGVLCRCMMWHSLMIDGSKSEVRVRETRETERRREKKTNKIINASATITVHICVVTVAIVHKYTILHHWYGCFFTQNVYNEHLFFHFAQFCINWCSCSKDVDRKRELQWSNMLARFCCTVKVWFCFKLSSALPQKVDGILPNQF